MARLIGAALALALSACGGPPPCTSSLACGEGRVCGLDGQCGPLEEPAASRFAGSRWMEARDWGIAAHGARPIGDALVVGGPAGAEALLAFGPLPGGSRILRALLVLQPQDEAGRVSEPGEILVERSDPFRGGSLPARTGPRFSIFAAARRALSPGPARSVRVDLTALARAAAAREDRTLYLLLRLDGGDPEGARFASPWALGDGRRPRLELMLH